MYIILCKCILYFVMFNYLTKLLIILYKVCTFMLSAYELLKQKQKPL